MRSGLIGSVGRMFCLAGVVALLLPAASGCARRRKLHPQEREYSRHERKTLFRPYTRPMPEDVVMAPELRQQDFNDTRLRTLPAGVQSRFGRDFEGAEIVRVEQKPSGAGPMLYRVVYLKDGIPGETIYKADGEALGDEGTIPSVDPDEAVRMQILREHQRRQARERPTTRST
jgi:hypothetical protein